MMYAVLHPPNFFAQVAAHQRTELRRRPFVVLDGEPPREMVFAVNKAARSLGVEIGMTRLQAETSSEVVVLPRVIEYERTAYPRMRPIKQRAKQGRYWSISAAGPASHRRQYSGCVGCRA
jgi:protein ImuB